MSDTDETIKRAVARTSHFHDPSIFDDPKTDYHDIADALFNVAYEHDLSPEAQALIGGLSRAFYGRSPFHHIKVAKAKSGSKIRFAAKIERAHAALEMADAIDMAVASGEKQEAAVELAATRLCISRREVFRRLSEIRQQRLVWAAPMVNGRRNPTYHMYIPAGYEVGAEGQLVRLESTCEPSDK